MKTRPILVALGLGWTMVQSYGQLTETYAFHPSLAIPDGNATGESDAHVISSSAISTIGDLTVDLTISGSFNGDLYLYLRHETQSTPGNFSADGWAVLVNRPGRTASSPAGYDDSGLQITLSDSASDGDLHTYRLVATPAPGAPLIGTFQPDGRQIDPGAALDSTPRTALLDSFNGKAVDGRWTLFGADLVPGGISQIDSWQLNFTAVPEPTEYAWAVGLALTAFGLWRRTRLG